MIEIWGENIEVHVRCRFLSHLVLLCSPSQADDPIKQHEERNPDTLSGQYIGARGVMICFDLTDRETFAELPKWFREVEQYSGKNTSVMVIGTLLLCFPPALTASGMKCDLDKKRKVTFEEAKVRSGFAS